MTKSQIQFVHSLSQQKYRKAHNAYLVEGDKNAKEWLASTSSIQMVIALETWLNENRPLLDQHPEAQIVMAKDFELEKSTSLKTAQEVILVVQQAPQYPMKETNDWALLLEKVQNPGNMGTIIRIADWFGIETIYCTEDCVEVYNPKVIQATMGSFLRVKIHFIQLKDFLDSNKATIYATCLQGQSVHDFKEPEPGIIALGNESVGLSKDLIAAAQYPVTIPGKGKAESLNVAVATGIICAALIR